MRCTRAACAASLTVVYMQLADAASSLSGAISAAVEAWYTAAGWQGNKVGGARPRGGRPPPPPRRVLCDLLRTLHTVPNLTDLDPITLADDTANEVKKAYLKCARVIHPDKLGAAALEVRALRAVSVLNRSLCDVLTFVAAEENDGTARVYSAHCLLRIL